jgi:hypothetical protein
MPGTRQERGPPALTQFCRKMDLVACDEAFNVGGNSHFQECFIIDVRQ